MKEFILIGFIVIFLVPLSSAAHFIVGQVINASDNTPADGHIIIAWIPSHGINDNLTDIIGPSGNSGAHNVYMIDCELLTTSCIVGDQVNIKVMNNGDNYITNTISITVSASGFDIASNLRLNTPPNVTLVSPAQSTNSSNSTLNFACNVSDIDNNLANVTLYGNWSGVWSANQTIATSGNLSLINFTKTISDGAYEWSCQVTDNLSVSAFALSNRTFLIDTIAPNITAIEANVSVICSIPNTVRVNCSVTDATTSISSIFIEARNATGERLNYTSSLLSGNTYYSDIEIPSTGTWTFTCQVNDTLNNIARKNLSVLVGDASIPDLRIESSDIVFDRSNAIENQTLIINATIYNNGCGTANNVLVGFYENDPSTSGAQIGSNVTTTVLTSSNVTVNITWLVKIGSTPIFVLLDVNNSIIELNESNNKASRTYNLSAWQNLYGNASVDKILANGQIQNLTLWENESFLSGNVYVVDAESNINWHALRPLGKNTTYSNTTNDFADLDELLNMSSLSDSVSSIFTSDGNTPKKFMNFFIQRQNILAVPIINSTNNTNFQTGILWDSSDSTNGEFDQSDKEDIIFATQVNETSSGAYGIYDYEIKFPAKLRSYKGPDIARVNVYFELN